MSAYSGRVGKGAKRRHRDLKAFEASLRASVTHHENTRAHREGRCDATDCPGYPASP